MPSRPEIDMTTLAEQARTVLASGRCALLTLPHARVRGWVGLVDDGGEPLLLVSADSAPTRCAAAGRRGRVDVPGHSGERLVLSGVLRELPGSAEQIMRRLADLGRTITFTPGQPDDLRVVTISVDEVMICLPMDLQPGTEANATPDGVRTAVTATGRPGATGGRGATWRPRRVWTPVSAGRHVDLTAYALAEPDLLLAYAPDLIEHLNTAHADQMRRLATRAVPAYGADLLGADPLGADSPGAADRPAPRLDDILGVQVIGLDHMGMDMWRIGPDGADKVRVTFQEYLSEPRSLGRELRRLLDMVERDRD